MSMEVKKYEISLTVNGRNIIVKIQRPSLNYIDNYFENLAGDDNTYFINFSNLQIISIVFALNKKKLKFFSFNLRRTSFPPKNVFSSFIFKINENEILF